MAFGKGVGTNPVDTPLITLSGPDMPMRKLTIHACALGVTLSSSLLASANAASWDGSYAADGECFCTGTQGRDIDSLIVPTPIGGQSIKQVCERLGTGPALQKVNGKFNFPVYADAQCGNGPFSSDAASIDENCSGHLGVAGEDCVGKGPEWNIKSAYATPAETKPGISESRVVTGGSHYITPPPTTSVSSATVDSVASTPVAQIANVRSQSKRIVKPVPLTPEQLRARQLVQIEAARERARLRAERELNESATNANPVLQAAQSESDDGGEIILTEEQKALKAKAESAVVAKKETETAVETVTQLAEVDSSNTESTAATLPGTYSALRLPVATRNSAREFDYVEGMPVTYDFGGAGMSVGASVSSQNRMQFLLQASAAETYQEALLGIGFIHSPKNADRLTLLVSAGVEYGKFEFQGSVVDANLSSTGAYLGLSSRFVVNNKFELQAGVGYSSFFEGDATVFGSAFYHLTPNLDLTTKAEAGDNDSLGFGIRYYY